MNSKAKHFTEDYDVDCINAITAITNVLGSSGDDLGDIVCFLFLAVGLTHIEYCGQGCTDNLASFVMDVYCYYGGGFSEWIYEWDEDEKREYIFDKIEHCQDKSILTPDGLFVLLSQYLDVCEVYDNNEGTNTRAGLAAALTRFAYLLINMDNRITSREEEFYSLLRVGLSKPVSPTSDVRRQHTLSRERRGKYIKQEEMTAEQELTLIVDEINSLIGLDSIKREISDLLNLEKVQQMRKVSGLPSFETSKHMVFYGNPGTGKTTIARKISLVYRALGVLSKGHLIEADRSNLVGGYLGQTAIKTKEILEESKGGILFIDEAYSLCQEGSHDQYGQEAINTILKYMEDNRDDIVIIVAGYKERMERFIESNPGLKSRFSKYFLFPDYSAPELVAIFSEIAKNSKYHITPAFFSVLDRICQLMVMRKTENFGNGRTIRNLFERCISNQANRLVSIPNPTQEQLLELTDSDISMYDLEMVLR